MKSLRLLALFVFVAAASRLDAAVWPMPELPSVPAGQSSASYPAPRVEWLQRVQANLEQEKKQARTVKLVFDGDSITDNWQNNGKDVWARHYAPLGAFDFAIGGDRTEHLLWRLSQGQGEGMHPKLIAVMIGTNNLGSNSSAEIADGIKTVVAEYQKRFPDAVILLQAIFPRGELPIDPARAKIKEINGMISKLGDGKKVIYVDFGDKFLQPGGTISRKIMPDFLHPSAAGYKIWADAIQPVIDRIFPGAPHDPS